MSRGTRQRGGEKGPAAEAASRSKPAENSVPLPVDGFQSLRLECAERVRQAETARMQAEARQEELEVAQSGLAVRQRQELREVSRQLVAAREELKAATAKNYALEVRFAQVEVSCDALRAEGQELGERVVEQDAELRALRRELSARQEELAAQAADLQERLARAEAQAEERQENFVQAEAARQDLEARLRESGTLLEELAAQAADLQERLAQAEAQTEKRQRNFIQAEAARQDLEARLRESGTLLGEREAHVAGLQERLTQAEAQAHERQEQARKAIAEVRAGRSKAEAGRQTLESETRQLREKLLRQVQEAGELRTALQESQGRLLQKEEEHARLYALHMKDNKRHAGTVAELNSKVSALQQELVCARGAVIEADHRAEAAKRTISFRLGYTLIHGFKSWHNAKRLPGDLLRIHLDASKRRAAKLHRAMGEASEGDHSPLLHDMEQTYAAKGFSAAESFARKHFENPPLLASALTHLTRIALHASPAEALRTAREATQLDPRPFRRKWLAFLLFDSGHIAEAQSQLALLPRDQKFKSSERNKAEYIAGCHRLLTGGIEVPEPIGWPVYRPEDKRILYVASSSLPHHVSGYTLRTQGIVRAISADGWDVVCVTRPGYPEDRHDACGSISTTVCTVEEVRYERLSGPHRRKTPPDQYLRAAAESIAAKARELRPAVIHAASNYEAAIPALLAARALGVPFVYEVRGLWEFTTASKHPGWETSERFALDRKLESLAACNADFVFTLTGALSAELRSRGVESGKLALAPNCIDTETFTRQEKDRELVDSLGLAGAPFVVGYIGSIVAYEGLDDLVAAFGLVRKKVPGAKLLLVGDGQALPALRAQAETLGGSVVIVGRVAPEDIPRYFSLLDAVALPRKPLKVCELVSPLKPLEAMAFGVPLVVSDVAALKEMVRDGVTALVHRAGDPAALTDCLLRLAGDRQLARTLTEAARRDVCENRNWRGVVQDIGRIYEDLINKRPAPAQEAPPQDAPGPGGLLGVSLERPAVPPVRRAPSPRIAPVPVAPGRSVMTMEQRELFTTRLGEALAAGGVAQLRQFVAAQIKGHSPTLAAFCLLAAANILLEQGLIEEATNIAEQALQRDATLGTLRSAARIFYNAAFLSRAVQLVNRVESKLTRVSESDRRFITEVRGRAQLAQWAAGKAVPRTLPCVEKRVLNVLAFSLPYTSVGYATRSHGLAMGVRHAGWDIRPYTRPGFPVDFNPELEGRELPTQDEVDGVVYRRVFDTARRGSGEVEYLLSAIPLWERIFAEERPEVVHAASNYVTALPALIAARRLGIPFAYEVRGFWEVTRTSRDENFVHTPKFRFMELFERLVASHADHVITITTAMKEELVRRGVPEDRISIAFNSVDPSRFIPRPPNRELAESLGIPEQVPVIGYVGSFVDYEGLDDLIAAVGRLKQVGVDCRLLLVGNGADYERIQQQIVELDLDDTVLLTGRVPFELAEEYYSLVDIAPFPRKPWPVCELVSPLKPFEAMATGKAVVVSSTRALSEIVSHEHNGLVFEKGNVAALEKALKRLLLDPGLRRTLGKNGRKWIIEERNWDRAGEICVRAYAQARQVAELPG